MNASLGADLPSLAVLAERVGAPLRRRGETVAVVESSAGGLVSASLLAIPGASAFYIGGAVVYSRRAARALLGLTAADLAGMRGETEPYALLVVSAIETGGVERATNMDMFARHLLQLLDEVLQARVA